MSERRPSIELILAISLVLCAILVGVALYTRFPAQVPGQQPPIPNSQIDVGALAKEMAAIRELPLTGTIPWQALDEKQLKAKLIEMNKSELEQQDLASSEKVLKFLGLVPAQVNLENLLTDLYGEQILGFYDDAEKKLYIVDRQQSGALERLTFAHELVHGLQDQNFGLSNYLPPEFKGSDDALTAIQSLFEGDASLAESLYLQQSSSLGSTLSLLLTSLQQDTSKLEAAPPYVQASLMFPYSAGLSFVQEIYAQGGWTAVDNAYAQTPASSEQIMHPEKHLANDDPPLPVEIPEYPEDLSGWTLVRDNVLGEFDFQTWFRTLLPREQADLAAAGWGGSHYQLWQKGDQQIFLMNSRWDSSVDADEAAYGLEVWLKERFQEAPEVYYRGGLYQGLTETAILYPDRDAVQLVVAPDKELAARLIKALP